MSRIRAGFARTRERCIYVIQLRTCEIHAYSQGSSIPVGPETIMYNGESTTREAPVNFSPACSIALHPPSPGLIGSLKRI